MSIVIIIGKGGKNMRNGYWASAAMIAIALLCAIAPGEAASPGEQAFMTNCAVCHPNGGNIINPDNTLGKKALAANGIRTPADIVGKMRKPGPGMTQFDEKAIPDGTAKTIAEYILNTFN
jgi:cytochrome c6